MKLARVVVLVLMAWSLCCVCSAAAEQGLSIEIVPEVDEKGQAFLDLEKSFVVKVSNHRKRSVRIWKLESVHAHDTLTFRYEGGNLPPQISKRRPVDDPAAFKAREGGIDVMGPGGSVSWEVDLMGFFWGKREWENFPEPNGPEPVLLSVALNMPNPEDGNDHGTWTGTVVSKPIRVQLIHRGLSTPHDYLWNQCPRRALELMKAEPASVGRRDDDSRTPLHIAARFGQMENLDWLLKNGAEVNAKAYNGFTPLHLTTDPVVAQRLIDAGADLTLRDSWGQTPLQKAARSGWSGDTTHVATCEVLIAAGAELDLVSALKLGRREYVIDKINKSPEMLQEGVGGRGLWGNGTPLGQVAGQGDLELVKLMIKQGAPVNGGTERPETGIITPIGNAVWGGHLEVVRVLLEHGASLKVSGGKRYSTIVAYAEKNSSEEMKALLKGYDELKENIQDTEANPDKDEGVEDAE